MTARNLLGNLALDSTLQSLQAVTAQLLAQLQADQNPSGTAMVVSGVRDAFRDGFTTGTVGQPVNPAVWTLTNQTPDTALDGRGHVVVPGGNSQGSAYLRVSLSPFVAGSSVELTSKAAFTMPIKPAWGISGSQRFLGQEVLFGFAEQDPGATDPAGINRTPQPADLQITGTVTTNGTIATIAFATPHGLNGNDRVVVVGNTEKRLDVGPVFATVVDALTITVPNSLGAGTYTAGGVVRAADPTANANNAAIELWGDNTATTNATYVSRRNGTKARTSTGQNAISSTPTQVNANPYSDAWIAAGPSEVGGTIEEVLWRNWGEGIAGITGYQKMQQSIPDETLGYRLYARARNLDNISRPIARIVSAAKSGSTLVTVTTDVAHGLVVGDIVSISGVRDQTNFPTGTPTVVTILTPTSFTLGLGPSATATDLNGGTVWLNRGNVNAPGLIGSSIASIASTVSGVLAVTMSGTVSGVQVGDSVQLHGLLGAGAQAYEGAYKVLRLTGSILELAPIYGGTVATFGAINTGGTVIRRTDVRLHFCRMQAYSRVQAEIIGGRGNTSDANNAVPTTVTAFSPAITVFDNVGTGTEAMPASTTPLTAGATFTGGTVDSGTDQRTRHSVVRIVVNQTCSTSQNPGTIIFEQSENNFTSTRETQRIPVPMDFVGAPGYHQFEVPVTMRYWRVKFVNNATATQTAFFIGYGSFRGEENRLQSKSLLFPLTPAAGSAQAINNVFTSSVIDLGADHAWSIVRAFFRQDQPGAANGTAIEQSMDGTTWFRRTATTLSTGQIATMTEDIYARYLRVTSTNNATNAATLFAGLTLVTL